MMNKIIKSKSKFEKAKNDTKKLIESVREYLQGKMGLFTNIFTFTKAMLILTHTFNMICIKKKTSTCFTTLLVADMMEPEDIDKVASAVLAINLPRSPDEIKKMIQDIQKMMENFTHITEDLKGLEDQAKLARDLKNKADEIL